MSKNLFGGVPAEQPANVEAEPVVETPEAKVDGETSEQERKFTGGELAEIVKDRLKREQKKLSKQYETRIAELEAKVGNNQAKPSTNVEEDLRSKLSKYEEELKAREAKLTKYKTDNLRSTIEKKFASAGCIDPELVVNDLLARNVVYLGDDDEVVVENATGSLDDLAKDYLSKKPHLKMGTSQGGTGSKGPSRPAASNDLHDLSDDELRARLGGTPKKKVTMFGR